MPSTAVLITSVIYALVILPRKLLRSKKVAIIKTQPYGTICIHTNTQAVIDLNDVKQLISFVNVAYCNAYSSIPFITLAPSNIGTSVA